MTIKWKNNKYVLLNRTLGSWCQISFVANLLRWTCIAEKLNLFENFCECKSAIHMICNTLLIMDFDLTTMTVISWYNWGVLSRWRWSQGRWQSIGPRFVFLGDVSKKGFAYFSYSSFVHCWSSSVLIDNSYQICNVMKVFPLKLYIHMTEQLASFINLAF